MRNHPASRRLALGVLTVLVALAGCASPPKTARRHLGDGVAAQTRHGAAWRLTLLHGSSNGQPDSVERSAPGSGGITSIAVPQAGGGGGGGGGAFGAGSASVPEENPFESDQAAGEEAQDPDYGVEIYERIIPSPAVKTVAEELQIASLPMLTQWRYIDQETGLFSYALYQQNIWRPDKTSGIPVEFGDATRYGVPPGWSDWVMLDYEQWNILNQDTMNNFISLIAATRTLRPSAEIDQYWRPDLGSGPPYLLAEKEILRRADAICPPLYLLDNLDNLEGQLVNRRLRVEYCIELALELNLRVYPIVWKRYTAGQDANGMKIQRLLPPDLIVELTEIAMTPLDDVRVDGVIVFGNDNEVRYYEDSDVVHPDTPTQQQTDATDIQCLQIVRNVAEQFKDAAPVHDFHPIVTLHYGGD